MSTSPGAIVVDLGRFDPSKRFPGWTGTAASQTSTGIYPQDRDLVVIGHSTQMWTGGGFIRGGRNVAWNGGTYLHGPWLRNFTGDASMEGVLVRAPFVAESTQSGDGLTLIPDATTMGRSRVSIINCRVENVDGYREGQHGDIFQLSPTYASPSGYGSCPATVTIERLTGSTGYQGLFLPNQHFDNLGYSVSIQQLTLIDVNVAATRSTLMSSPGVAAGAPVLLYMVDMSNDKRGDSPYPKTFQNVYLQPAPGVTVDRSIYPNRSSGVNPHCQQKLCPSYSPDGTHVTYPAAMMLDGEIRIGAPPNGDFAKAAGANGCGGLDTPGMGYVSPGYL